MNYRADHYYRYDEMTEWLQSVADAHPKLVDLRSIGTTPEGREIWVAAITDRETGEADEKPAYWIDGNTHATELMGSAASLYTIDHVIEHAEKSPVCELLADFALYIAPRINPDGAEWALETGKYVRSAPRFYPEQHPRPGLVPEDVDGDGEILQMRVRDPDGAWRRSDEDPRLLVPRAPWDREGPFYHLYIEGRFDSEAAEHPQRPVGEDPHGLDFNRNYPCGWSPEHEQKGAGRYPLSEPETRAVAEFLSTRRNVFGALSYHTLSGVLLRPYSRRPDHEMPEFDREVYDLLGDRCEFQTGFEAASTFHEFSSEGKPGMSGAFDDWAYNHLGIHAFTFELWSPWRHAGLDFTDDYLRFFRGRTEAENLAMLRWNDEELDGEGFFDWKSFEHSQLGEVEIGGWRWLFTWRNAPPELLAGECEDACRFSLDHAAAGPRPALELGTEPLDDALHRLTATVENRGYLPTDVSAHAREADIARDLHVELETSGDLELLEGRAHRRIDHLDGRANVTQPHASAFTWRGESRSERRELRWLVRGTGTARVLWHGDGIGVLEEKIELPD